MIQLNPYINFDGKTEEAFTLYKSILGGEFTAVQRFGETPDVGPVAEDAKDKIMHIALPIGNNVLMGTDMLESMGQKLTEGNNCSMALQVDTKEDADRIFTGLSEGGTIEMPIADVFWGDYFGAFTDKYGMHWMVNYTYPKN